jgi:hypothetical protein
MRRLTFRLITIGSFCLLLFSLYLNFIYKVPTTDFAPISKDSANSTTAAKKLAHHHGIREVLLKN